MSERLRARSEQQERFPSLTVVFSAESEIERIRYTLTRYDWYKQQGYPCVLPAQLMNIKAGHQEITDADIMSATHDEYDPTLYQEQRTAIIRDWDEQSKAFFKTLATTNVPLAASYIVTLTRYGVGGSYHMPNRVVLNTRMLQSSAMSTVFHEITHLALEQIIQQHNIDHWTKERLIDLVVLQCTGIRDVQGHPPHAEEIEHIVQTYFPDIKRILQELSTLPSEET